MSPTELKQLMEKMFSISRSDFAFFYKNLSELVKTDEGKRLINSLSAHFDGHKIELKTKRNLKELGYFSDDKSEICIGLPSLWPVDLSSQTLIREVIHGYPKILLHELTHWEQFLHKATGGNIASKQDQFFTLLMAEADAQVSGNLFQAEQKSSIRLRSFIFNPIKQILKISFNRINPDQRIILNIRRDIQKEHPEWDQEHIDKEARKKFFRKSIMNKKAHWRRVYEDPKMVTSATSGPYLHREFPEVMAFYMKKYGFTLDECLEMKKEILAQTGQKFLVSDIHSSQFHLKSVNTQILTSAQRSHAALRQRRRFSDTSERMRQPIPQTLKPSILSRFSRGGQGK
ncbi:MAG: hypothetical protein IJV07_00650 [Alphaproteobacteria bacterium]|nr:hypothetical protein [Alphaproteobacteria bacterium]